MNAYQQKVVSDRLQKDAMFIQAYGQETAMKRSLREKSVETVMRVAATNKENIDIEEVLKRAQKVFDYMIKDGGLESISENNVQMV